MTVTSTMPSSRFSRTVSVVTWMSPVRSKCGFDPDAGQQSPAGSFNSSTFSLTLLRASRVASFLRIRTMPCTLSVLVHPDDVALGVADHVAVVVVFRPAHADLAQARLIADHHALRAAFAPARRSASGRWASLRFVWIRRRDESSTRMGTLLTVTTTMSRISRSVLFLAAKDAGGEVGLFMANAAAWDPAAAEEADAAHVHGDRTLPQVAGPDVGVAVADGVLKLLQGDAVALEPIRVRLNFVALDHAAEARHVGDARDAAKVALQHPVLQRFQIGEGVNLLVARGLRALRV